MSSAQDVKPPVTEAVSERHTTDTPLREQKRPTTGGKQATSLRQAALACEGRDVQVVTPCPATAAHVARVVTLASG